MRLIKQNNYLIFCIVLTLLSCKKNGKMLDTSIVKESIDSVREVRIKLPQTPESLVREWEENVNRNEFELPRLVSKGEVLNLVNSVEASNLDQKLPIFPMKILSLKCSEQNDIGNCTCKIQNDIGEQIFLYTLIKDKGQWYLTKVESADDLPTSGTNKTTAKSL